MLLRLMRIAQGLVRDTLSINIVMHSTLFKMLFFVHAHAAHTREMGILQTQDHV